MNQTNPYLIQCGKNRNYEILEGLEKFHYLTTNQIAELYFQKNNTNDKIGIINPTQRIQKTTDTMNKLFKKGFVNRYRFPPEPYVYYLKTSKFTTHINHYLMIVNCWILLNKLKPLDTTLTCKVQTKQEDILITDLLVHKITKNQFRSDEKVYFLEIENKSTGDIIQKIKQYEQLFWIRETNKDIPNILTIVFADRIPKKLININFNCPVILTTFNDFKNDWKW